MRTTKKHIESALAVYATACKQAGLMPEGMHLHLEEGNQTYGRGWAVCLTGDRVDTPQGPTYPKGSGCNRPPAGDNYLGWTMSEAKTALQDRAAGIWAVLNKQTADPQESEDWTPDPSGDSTAA